MAKIQVTRLAGIGKNQRRYACLIMHQQIVFQLTHTERNADKFTANQAQDVAAWLRTTAAGALYEIKVVA